jgi:1,4-dihydroxy-2-naphthoate octaprenyltransferase
MQPTRDPDYRYPDWMMETPAERAQKIKQEQLERERKQQERLETAQESNTRRVIAALCYLLGAILIGMGVWSVASEYIFLAVGIIVYITGILLGLE